MSLTIEHRVFNLICERLTQHLVSGALVGIEEGSDISLYDSIVASGTFAGSYPRSFILEVTAPGVCHVTEDTLFASLGSSAPAPINTNVNFVEGTPFAIGTTGVSVTLSNVETGYKWALRLGNAYQSILGVFEHPIDYSGLPAPSLAVYSSGNSKTLEVLDKTQSQMELDIVLTCSKEQVENGDHFEILGDIQDCINRDPKLWDNTTCLAENVIYTGDNYFDQTDRGNSIFVCNIQVIYRSSLKNARIK